MKDSIDKKKIEETLAYLRSVPYDVRPSRLYDAATLYAGYDYTCDSGFDECYDSRIYRHYLQCGKHTDDVSETFARTLHDYAIGVALDKFLDGYDRRHCVGVMGGHALSRTDVMYAEIARISKTLTERGFLMLGGGGPGAMEATHLGAWMAGRSEAELDDAFGILAAAPTYRDAGWLATAFTVIKRYPQSTYASLGIPTWLYGHEPSTPFATHIAKLFENSIREDNILTFAYGGVIYAPGSAGTMQEIFQDAVQNHYLSFGFSSPMIFLGREYWTSEMPVYRLLKHLEERGRYKNLLLTLTDDREEIIRTLTDFSEKVYSE